MAPLSPKPTKHSDITSKYIEGKDLSEMEKLWKDIAASEVRIKLMSDLMKKQVGFNDIENFSLGLEYNLKSDKLKGEQSKPTEPVVQAAMKLKIRDENYHQKELKRLREGKKKWLGTKHHPNTLAYKKTIKYLREQAEEVKRTQNMKYKQKKENLEEKHRRKEED